jgi:ATP-dependent DNA helicase RecG
MTTLKALVRQGPGTQIAFLPEPQPEQIAETLVSFANAEGGTLVLGVHPNGTVGDLLMEEEANGALRSALALCRPPMPTKWQQQETPAGIIVLLQVERSTDLHMLADGRALIRTGSENRPMDGPALQMTAANKSLGDFEMEPVPGATSADLDDEIIHEYLKKRQQRNPHGAVLPDSRMLEEIGAVTGDGTPTVSGILLFGKNPQTFLPHSRTVFVKFGGERPQGAGGSFGYGRREELTGPLARIVERAWRVTWEEMDKKAVVKGLTREEQLEYPQFAVREALINAVCHRDYRLRAAASKSACTPTGWKSSAPADCPPTSPWTTS